MSYDSVVMADLQEQLAEIHEEVVSQVLEDLKNGDRKARAEAMQLLKQNLHKKPLKLLETQLKKQKMLQRKQEKHMKKLKKN